MKRKGCVVNAQDYKRGKGLAKWAATGMNWGEPARSCVVSIGKEALADVRLLASLGHWARTQEGATQTTTTWELARLLGRELV